MLRQEGGRRHPEDPPARRLPVPAISVPYQEPNQ
jgi:hypothetical protein